MQRFEHAADADAARQMYVLADLGAGADRGPGIHHGAFIDIGADVDIGGHQDHVFGNEGAASCDRGRHHAETAGLERCFVVTGEFRCDLVEVFAGAVLHHCVVLQAEGQQHGFFRPFVGLPLAIALFGDAQRAGVEHGDGFINRATHIGRRIRRRQCIAFFPSLFDGVLQLLHFRFLG